MVNYYCKLYFKFIFKSLFASSKSNELKISEGGKKCIVCLAADYGNLGDVAITYAQSKYLKSLPGAVFNTSENLRASQPYSSITLSGSIPLPKDLDIFLP